MGRAHRALWHLILPKAPRRGPVHARHRAEAPRRTRRRSTEPPPRARRRAARARQGNEALERSCELTSEEETRALVDVGFHERHGVQYHWYRNGAASWEDYLSRFNSKRRNQLKRERREVDERGIQIRTLEGAALEGQAKLAYRLYRTTVDKFYWGRRYLTEKAFEIWTSTMQDRLRLVLATSPDGSVVAGAVNFQKGKRLYGRYWGCFEEVKHLHFNVCYYHGVEYCIANGLDVFEPGAGGEHKLVRGFDPTVMRSAHYLAEPRIHELIGAHLHREREMIAEMVAAAAD
ncbi:MAG: GNAT family N-acetyltransferase [Myxococcales bacterium]|nr:GNAT family N-acetyltransferase [Myxococcales bacterium]